MINKDIRKYLSGIDAIRINGLKEQLIYQTTAPVAELNRNEPEFYCVPAEAYKMIMDKLEDFELLAIAKQHMHEESIPVNIDDLEARR